MTKVTSLKQSERLFSSINKDHQGSSLSRRTVTAIASLILRADNWLTKNTFFRFVKLGFIQLTLRPYKSLFVTLTTIVVVNSKQFLPKTEHYKYTVYAWLLKTLSYRRSSWDSSRNAFRSTLSMNKWTNSTLFWTSTSNRASCNENPPSRVRTCNHNSSRQGCSYIAESTEAAASPGICTLCL